MEVYVPHREYDLDIAAGGKERLEPLTGVQIWRDFFRVEKRAEFGIVVEEEQTQQIWRRTVRSAIARNVFRLGKGATTLFDKSSK